MGLAPRARTAVPHRQPWWLLGPWWRPRGLRAGSGPSGAGRCRPLRCLAWRSVISSPWMTALSSLPARVLWHVRSGSDGRPPVQTAIGCPPCWPPTRASGWSALRWDPVMVAIGRGDRLAGQVRAWHGLMRDGQDDRAPSRSVTAGAQCGPPLGRQGRLHRRRSAGGTAWRPRGLVSSMAYPCIVGVGPFARAVSEEPGRGPEARSAPGGRTDRDRPECEGAGGRAS